jgi:hypothetical protein
MYCKILYQRYQSLAAFISCALLSVYRSLVVHTGSVEVWNLLCNAILSHSSSGRSFGSTTLLSGSEFKSHELCIASSSCPICIASTTPSSHVFHCCLSGIGFACIILWRLKLRSVSRSGEGPGLWVSTRDPLRLGGRWAMCRCAL